LVTPGIINEYLRILNLQFQFNGFQWDIPFHQDNVEINLVLTLSRDFLRFEVPLMAEEKVLPWQNSPWLTMAWFVLCATSPP